METVRDGAGDEKLDRQIKRAYLGGERMYKIRARTDKKKYKKKRRKSTAWPETVKQSCFVLFLIWQTLFQLKQKMGASLQAWEVHGLLFSQLTPTKQMDPLSSALWDPPP